MVIYLVGRFLQSLELQTIVVNVLMLMYLYRHSYANPIHKIIISEFSLSMSNPCVVLH